MPGPVISTVAVAVPLVIVPDEGAVQLNVDAPVAEALNCAVGVAHESVKDAGVTISPAGVAVSATTATVSEPTHPLLILVTVTL
jgi:hypothetical protein